jgi:hypothetical protein
MLALTARTPNPSLNRSAKGRPRALVWWYAVRFYPSGLDVLPLSPAWLERGASNSTSHYKHRYEVALIAIAFTMASAAAGAAPPSDESILALLEVTKAESMVDATLGNMAQMVRQGMAHATAVKTLTDEQRRVLEIAPKKMVAIMREQMNWSAMRPIYISIYKESFDQAEIDGLVNFYGNPIGQSFVAKMLIVMQRSIAAMQSKMQQFIPKMQESMKQALEEAKVTR